MAIALPRTEDRIGLMLAVLAHGALFGWLLLKPASPALPPVPPSMEVTISDSVGLTSTAPAPAAQPAPDQAPHLGEQAEVPQPVAPPPPKPVMKKPLAPDPIAKVLTSLPKVPAKPTHPNKPAPAAKPAGASRIGQNFLKGVPNTATKAKGTAHSQPAAAIGPAVRSALASAISRQLKPHWHAPDGVDTDKLVTLLSFDLNRDGSLAGSVRFVSQSGENDSNRRQTELHKENAIRAVIDSAPFNLPPDLYDAWKHLNNVRFDRNLSQ